MPSVTGSALWTATKERLGAWASWQAVTACTARPVWRCRGRTARGLAYAPYADLIWCETAEPNLDEARRFAQAIHQRFPGKLLAYNCSPSFNWRKKLAAHTIATFQDQLADLGYRFQFVTLAGFHALNHSMFELARSYRERGMAAYSDLQESEFASEQYGYSATRHQREVGASYFDEVAQVIASGQSSTTALDGSTEEEQFA